MKINIFGVGRSGTKAVQLWLTYLLLKEKTTAWVNYEPFFYRNKALKATPRGRLIHQASPLFMAEGCQINQGFEEFCQHLSDHETVVTKFIRGNGRINRINEIMRPDCSILVVRGLYEVLNSIALQDWNLVENKAEWQRLCQFARTRYPFLADIGLLEASGINKINRSAVYWFVMNMVALEDLKNTLVVDFSDRTSLEVLPAKCGLVDQDVPSDDIPSLDEPMFRGDNIHTAYPLEDLPQKNSSGFLGHQSELFRKLPPKIYKLSKVKEGNGSRDTRFMGTKARELILLNPLVRNESIGTCCKLSTSPEHWDLQRVHKVSKAPKVTIKVASNRIFDDLSHQVSLAIAQVNGQRIEEMSQ